MTSKRRNATAGLLASLAVCGLPIAGHVRQAQAAGAQTTYLIQFETTHCKILVDDRWTGTAAGLPRRIAKDVAGLVWDRRFAIAVAATSAAQLPCTPWSGR